MATHTVAIVGLWLLTIVLVDRWRAVVSREHFNLALAGQLASKSEEIRVVLHAALSSGDRHLRNKVEFLVQHLDNVHTTAKHFEEKPKPRESYLNARIGFRS